MTSVKAPWEEQHTNNDRSSIREQSDQMINQVEGMNTIVSSTIPSHPIMARIAHLFAELRSMQGDHTAALQHYEQAYKISDSMFGENHPLRALLLFEMAESAEKQGDDNKAIELLQQSIVDSTKSSWTHILILNTLAALYEKRKDWNLAITCYRDITYLHNLPPNSFELVEAYISIGMVFIPLQKFSEAVRNFQYALDLLRQHHPTEHSWPTNLRDSIAVIRNLFGSLGLPVWNGES
jgi:tetratricopeptide (TPR) repeat protein